MEKLALESSWEQVKSLILEAAPQLSEEDLHYAAGEDQQLIERLSKKMHKSYQDTKGWIESVSHTSGKAS